MAARSTLALLALTGILAALAGCATQAPAPPRPTQGASGTSPAGTAQPGASTATPGPGERPRTAPKPFHLGPAATALVAQAQHQAASGDYATAAGTLERALRIEPDNPLVWIELGHVHLSEGNAVQADAVGRKALALATGDAAAQASAWRLIADSLRARGRNADAYDADRRAASLAPH